MLSHPNQKSISRLCETILMVLSCAISSSAMADTALTSPGHLAAQRSISSDLHPENQVTMTQDKLAQLVNARICLEKHAALEALAFVNNALIRRLEKLNRQIDRAISNQDDKTYLLSHREFHFSLY